MFDRWQTLIASFDYINASFIFIIKACNYKNETCVYSLLQDKTNFAMGTKEVCKAGSKTWSVPNRNS
mgnify:CR=1